MRKLVPYTMPDGSRPASRLPVILSAVLAVAVVALLALNVYQYAAGAELRKQVDDLEAQTTAPQMLAPLAAGPNDSAAYKAMDVILNSYAPSIWYILDQMEFLSSYARVVPYDGTMLYHRYGCPYCDTTEFVVHNVNYLDSNGYFPCDKCEPSDSATYNTILYHYIAVNELLNLIEYGTEASWLQLAANSMPVAS